MTRHRRRRFKLRSTYNWHRYVGVTAALFVLLLAVTGLALNHTVELQLDKRFVKNTVLLDWYKIRAPTGPPSFPAADHWISQWEKLVFLDHQPLGEFDGKLLGATFSHDMFILALPNRLLLFTANGELIEELAGKHGVPAGMRRIGVLDDGRIAVRGAHGIYLSDTDFLDWQEIQQPVEKIHWSVAYALPTVLHNAIVDQYRGQVLSLERLLLDLHSGRFFGGNGVYVMDTAAILLVFLAMSGTWIWIYRIIKQRRHHKRPRPTRSTN
jgi:hypothetical protein